MKIVKKFWKWFLGIIIVLLVADVGAAAYFYHVAVVPGHKEFLGSSNTLKKSDPLYSEKHWFQKVKKQTWHQTSATGHLKLDAYYIPAAHKSDKTAVIAHGFMDNKTRMGASAAMFHKMGYNVLIPDDRGQGDSQGNYIGFGWPDRLDYIKWMNLLLKREGQNQQLVMYGVSMGGATTMMVSGEKNVPKQLKAYVEDCGYTSVNDEITYEAKTMYHLPYWPLVPSVSMMTQVRAGYNFKEASALKQVAKNHRPMLFIHGDKDTFVPTRMVYPLYKAAKGPKQLLIVKGATHAKSMATQPKVYQQTVRKFLAKYVK